ncbi:hypothetical protein KI387_024284, partial [Taxus chinensis]
MRASETRHERNMSGDLRNPTQMKSGLGVGEARRENMEKKHVEHPSEPDAHASSSSAPTQRKARNH